MTDAHRGTILAAIAGCVDTVTFVGLHGLFAAHVTGNFVLIGAALVLGTGGILAKLATFPVFMLSIMVTRWATRRLERPARPLLIAKAALLAGFAALALWLGPFEDPDGVGLMLAASLAVAAMGVQNALMRIAYPTSSPTTIMTGNTTGLMIDLADRVSGAAGEPLSGRLHRVTLTVLAFTLGCTLGAGGYALVGFGVLALPLAAQAWLIVGERRRPRSAQ